MKEMAHGQEYRITPSRQPSVYREVSILPDYSAVDRKRLAQVRKELHSIIASR